MGTRNPQSWSPGRTESTAQVPGTSRISAQGSLRGGNEDSPILSAAPVDRSQEGTMAKAAATRGNLSLVLFLILPLSCLETKLPADAASLCYDFIIGKSGSGPWWQVQGQLNKETFIYCDSNNNCQATGVLGNILSATKTWEPQVDTLRDAVDLFKALVVHMKPETNTITGTESLTLQAMMHCGHEVNGDFRVSWDFSLNGKKILHFDSSTGKLAEVDSESSEIKSMLEKDKDVTDFLYKTSQGDCMSWLEEIKSHWKEKLEPTGSWEEASTIAAANVNQPASLANKPNISVLLMILTCSLLFLLQYL